jgi:hypothetical protein
MVKILRSEEVPYHTDGRIEVWGFPVHADVKESNKLHVWYLVDEKNPEEIPFRLAYVETNEEFDGFHLFSVVYQDGYVAHVISYDSENDCGEHYNEHNKKCSSDNPNTMCRDCDCWKRTREYCG